MSAEPQIPAAATILIAEDELIVAEDLALTLRDLGYKVVGTASTGQLAIQLAEESKPDLILMDIRLRGEIDGIQASEQIRARFDIPIIFLTAYEKGDVLDRAKLTEPYGILAKPFSVYILQTTIETVLYKHAADKRVRESEERYRAVFDNVGVGIDVVDRDGRFVQVNNALVSMLGYTEHDFYDLRFSDITHPDDKEISEQKVASLMRGEISGYRLEKRYIKKDGSTMWGDLSVSAIQDAKGEHVATIGVIVDVTDRKQADEALRRSEARRAKAEELAGLYSWEWDIGTGRLVRSTASYRTFGMNPEVVDLDVDRFINTVHPDDRDRVRRAFEEAVDGVHPYDLEFRTVQPDGQERVLHSRGEVWRDEDGRAIRMQGMALDITDRKRAEEAQRQSEERYRGLVEQSIDGIVVIQGTTITFVNTALAKIFGFETPEEMEGKNILIFVAPEFRELMEKRGIEREEGKSVPNHYEFTALRKDGTSFAADLVVNLTTYRGAPARQGIIRDISERKKLEEELRQSREMLYLALEGANLGTWDWDLSTGKANWSERIYEMLGYEPNEFAANLKNWKRIVHPDDWPRVSETLNLHLKGQLPTLELQYRSLNKSSEWQWLQAQGTVIKYDGGHKPVRIAGVIADITGQRNLQRQLLHAQKMEAIGTIAGGIAHDFNNLLTVVQGFSELLLTEKDQKHPDYADLQKIFHAATAGADLVQRLLLFSRKAEPKPVAMNLNEQIVEVEKLLRRTIPRMIDIHLDLSSRLPEINADPTQIEQVLINLAVNASDAMPEKGSVTVRTRAVALDEAYCRLHVGAVPGNYVLLEVSDTGHGMDQKTVEHVFEPFFTTKEMGRGTGLGLAIVFGIVSQHNGHVTVSSEPGKGTTFKVYLPAIVAEPEPEMDSAGMLPAFGTETVLLVDDEEFVRELGARILTKHGYTVLRAENGKEALDLFQKERSRISLVILDLIMPEMGGAECLMKLLKIDPQVKVLVASGYTADGSIRENVQVGARGLVTKPFRVKDLLRKVRKVLDHD